MGAVVKTVSGELRGLVADGVASFLGVPYAAAPFGVHRLAPPQPPPGWAGIRDAVTLGAEPPQVAPPTPTGPPSGSGENWEDVGAAFEAVRRAAPSEDCLNLNLWAPDPTASGLPVMVWIQGGMFELSSTAAYDGSRFARDDVVCVVINWRPGAEGFLYLGDGVANLGLLDQVAALEWVRDNITAFGGDPHNVTVFGESAGAMSIGTLLAMPRAQGLFRRAILQSGAAHHVTPADDALRIGHCLAEKLGVAPTRAAIADAGIPRLLAAQAALKADLLADPDPDRWGWEVVTSTMPWQPVVDGDTVPGLPIDRIAAGSSRDVDILVGTNTDDWRLWLVVSGAIAGITDEMLTGPVTSYGYQSLAAYGLSPQTALAAYRARHPGAAPGDVLTVVQTDWWMRIPAIALADAHAAATAGSTTAAAGNATTATTGQTYMYEFAWPAPGLGAVHAVEVPFVFDTLSPDAPLFGPLLGDHPPQALADTMHAAWVSFASTGDAGWTAYDLGKRATMRFDTTSEVVDDPRSWERELWRGIR